jgi:hypothetical protein
MSLPIDDPEHWLQLARLDAARSTPHSSLIHIERALECGLQPTRVRDDALLAPVRALGAPFDDLMMLFDAAPMCGYVEKQGDAGPLRRRWRKRWLVRRGDRLLFFASHSDCSVPMASIDLASIHQLARSAREPLRFDLVARDAVCHRLRTATRGETDRWVAALSETLSLLARRARTVVVPATAASTDSERRAAESLERAAPLISGAPSPQSVITVDVALLRDLCDEVASLQAQVAALQRQLAASRDTQRRLMLEREQLHDLKDTIEEISQRDDESLATESAAMGERDRRTLHAMAVISEVDKLEAAARAKKQPVLPRASEVRTTLYGALKDDDAAEADDNVQDEDDDAPPPPTTTSDDEGVVLDVQDLSDQEAVESEADVCMRCKSANAEMMVTVDDNVPERLCGACTTNVQQVADEQNALLLPLPSEPEPEPTTTTTTTTEAEEPTSRARDPRRRTIVAIESIMRLQMQQAETLQRRKAQAGVGVAVQPPAAAAATTTVWARAKKRSTAGLSTTGGTTSTNDKSITIGNSKTLR